MTNSPETENHTSSNSTSGTEGPFVKSSVEHTSGTNVYTNSPDSSIAGIVVTVAVVTISIPTITIAFVWYWRKKSNSIDISQTNPADHQTAELNLTAANLPRNPPKTHETKFGTISPPLVMMHLRSLGNTDLKELGLMLGLSCAHMNRMATESFCLSIVNSWLRMDDNVLTTSGEPSWKSLANSLEQIGMIGPATNIRKKFDMSA